MCQNAYTYTCRLSLLALIALWLENKKGNGPVPCLIMIMVFIGNLTCLTLVMCVQLPNLVVT